MHTLRRQLYRSVGFVCWELANHRDLILPQRMPYNKVPKHGKATGGLTFDDARTAHHVHHHLIRMLFAPRYHLPRYHPPTTPPHRNRSTGTTARRSGTRSSISRSGQIKPPRTDLRSGVPPVNTSCAHGRRGGRFGRGSVGGVGVEAVASFGSSPRWERGRQNI